MRATLIIGDAPTSYSEFPKEPHVQANIHSWLGTPLLIGNEPIGMIALDKHEPGFYTEEHARLAEAFAAQAAIAVANSQLFEAEREQRELAEALAQGAKMLLSAGAVQSNHCRQVAAAAARYGLGCTLILTGEPPAQSDGNLLLDEILGAQIKFTNRENRDNLLQKTYAQAEAAGQSPYLIPYGGSNATGALAYAAAFEEMMNQDLEPDWVIFASSSGGTQALSLIHI